MFLDSIIMFEQKTGQLFNNRTSTRVRMDSSRAASIAILFCRRVNYRSGHSLDITEPGTVNLEGLVDEYDFSDHTWQYSPRIENNLLRQGTASSTDKKKLMTSS